MLRLRDGQSTLWEELLPAEARLLSAELAAVDALLDDERFLQPFIERFSCPIGRPTIPMETYLRLLYLKHRYGLGYETLVKEVTDSLSWRRFCRIRLDAPVPHPTTLMKLTRRFGAGIIEQLNEALLKAAVERRVLRSRRMRVDTTVMEADVRYPTDSGLCAHAISRLTRAVRRVKQVGIAIQDKFRDRRRAAGKVIRNVSHSLGRSRGRAAIDRLTGEVHRLAKAALAEAERVVGSAREELRRHPRPGHGWVARLADEIERARRVIEQTTRRLAGEKTIPNRVISLTDLDARPIRRGKPQRPTEFGYKVSIADTAEGFVVSHQVHVGAPADADTLDAALEGAKRTGMRIGTVLADRGYGNETADRILTSHGITDAVVPRVGAAAPVQNTRAWKRRYRFRAGCEGRISHLKRRHGLERTRLKGHEGAKIWAGFGVLAHNLDRMVALS
jgi:transposase, IS5 family